MWVIDRDTVQEQYDRYITYYNESANPITTYVELLTIKEGLQQRLNELEDKVDISIEDLEYKLSEIYNPSSLSDEKDTVDELQVSINDRLKDDIIDQIKWEVERFNHISDSDNFLKYYSKEIKKLYERFSKQFQELDPIRTLRVIVWNGEQYQQAYYHLKGLKSVASRVIDEDYPLELKDYKNLEEHEKEEVVGDSRSGAPLKEEVPQEKIKKIVDKCIKDKSSKRFIHQSGSRKGKANQSQIFKYIEEKHPKFVKGSGENQEKGVERRTIIRRIKKALPNNMT